MEIKIWILSGTLSFLIGIMVLFIRSSSSRLLRSIDRIIDELKGINRTVTEQKGDIKRLVDEDQKLLNHLNDHEQRIRTVEKEIVINLNTR